MPAIIVLLIILVVFGLIVKKYSVKSEHTDGQTRQQTASSNDAPAWNQRNVEEAQVKMEKWVESRGKTGDEIYEDLSNSVYRIALMNAKQLRTDLIEMTSHYKTCGECAKYQGRVYSISGKDKRFPSLPETLKITGKVHDGCRHGFHAYMADIVSHEDLTRAIKYSNRPFEDNRGEEEKEEYEAELLYQQQMVQDRKDYAFLIKNLPDVAPKSFGGYRKMKNAKSKNYLLIVAKAEEMGYAIN